MKKLALSLGLLMCSGVYASETLIMEVPGFFMRSESKAKFEVNKEMGRAWVTLVTTENQGARRDRYERETRGKVEGLSFDASSSAIVYEVDGALHECAKVVTRGRSIFRYNKIIPTGCQLRVKETRKPHDDGYHTTMRDVTQVFLITK